MCIKLKLNNNKNINLLTNFASLDIRSKQVHNFKTSLQNFLLNAHLDKLWSFCVDVGKAVTKKKQFIIITKIRNGLTTPLKRSKKYFKT